MAELPTQHGVRTALFEFDILPGKLVALPIVRDNPGCDRAALGESLWINRASAMKLVTA